MLSLGWANLGLQSIVAPSSGSQEEGVIGRCASGPIAKLPTAAVATSTVQKPPRGGVEDGATVRRTRTRSSYRPKGTELVSKRVRIWWPLDLK